MAHGSGLLRPTVLVLLVAVAVSGCATGKALRAGQDAEFMQDYDRAVVEYTRVLREDPQNRDARQGLERARQRAALEHFTRGRRLSQTGRLDEAAIELQIAADLNPTSPEIDELLATVRTQLRNKIAISREGKTELESLVERARMLPPPGAELPDVRLPDSLTWNGSARMLYSFIAKTANISIAFDEQFVDRDVNIDLRNLSLEEGMKAVSSSTRNFYQVTAPRTVIVIPDTPAKRQQYEEEIVQTFPLSNAELKEVADLLRIVVDNRRLSFITANNTIAIKDTPERVKAAGRLIAALDKARPEVVIDVEILEVDRTQLREYGLQIANAGDPPTGLNGVISVDGDDLTLQDLQTLSRSDIFLTVPSLFYRLLKQDTHTRTLANTQIRISDGQRGQARFGDEVPVPVTTFTPIATGGLPQQPTVSYNYRTIGVNIDITPRTHHDDDVTLQMVLEVSSLSGTGFNGLPTFGTRAITTVNRLKDGETNLLAGLIRDEDRRVKAGVPGLSDIPAIGRVFAHNRRQSQETDVVITLTPRIIRVLDLTEADVRAFRVDDSSGAPLDIVLPIPGALPPPDPAQQQPPQPVQPQPVQPQPPQQPQQPAPGPPEPPPPGPVGPIFPPVPPQGQPPPGA